ncbi:MAG: pyridoxamine 5'-phosphate oxidase family protein [Thermomicrobiales bacterium]|nr:pyridoxamine 5'-phosphate oxidase family protein [Thermomicrobiales bacterium]MCO5220409.1 pyridoxamine 5'-phosphate oxidase family protein [Thermomicrobiales bacterium]
MSNNQPISVKNIDRYGNPPLEWSTVLERLENPATEGAEQVSYLGTVSPEGAPHLTGIGSLWHDGQMYFTSGPGTAKSRYLDRNPQCSIASRLRGMDLVLEGTASIVTDPETLEAVAAHYRADGWPAQAENGALVAPYSAQSAGPPPWNLYRLDLRVAHVLTVEEPYCATLWTFGA